jgi:glucosaminylphosphatidylinositol acyltransferase
MMIATIIAILAVDFSIFPRRFAKVETWGASLMDLGVGSFVFSAGVVSSRILFKEENRQKRPSMLNRFLGAARHSFPLFVLGFIRLLSVKGLDYAEHVSEYGVHWNFFFTLGFLPLFLELAETLPGMGRPESRYAMLALVISTCYEIVLNNTNLLAYILTAPRGPDLLSKNREGVFSFLGYLAIFLQGRATGTQVIPLHPVPKLRHDPVGYARAERNVVIVNQLIAAAIPSALYVATTSVFGLNLNVSRRLANLPYVLWIAAFNNAQIALFAFVESLGPEVAYSTEGLATLKDACSHVMTVFNQNGLVIFLVANLLTGLVNLSVNTLDMGGLAAMAVLMAYAAACTAVAMGLNWSGLKIKL